MAAFLWYFAVLFNVRIAYRGVFGIGGMEWWNGMLEWNGGME